MPFSGRGVPALAVAFLVLAAPLALAGGGLDQYEVVWSESSSRLDWKGHLGEGDSRSLKLNVTQENLTGIQFLVTWKETHDDLRMSRADTFRFTVTSPDGAPVGASPVTGAVGALRVETGDLAGLPPSLSVKAGSTEEARRQLVPYTSQKGLGSWQMKVELLDAGNPQGASVDTGNDYEITVTLYYYEAGVFRVVSLEPPAGKGLLQSVEGEEAVWVWSSLGLTGAAALLGGFIVADRLGWNPFRRK